MDEKMEEANTKANVPPRARSINQLRLASAEAVNLSANKVSLVKKISKSDELEPENLYYFKEYNKNLYIAELEAYCGAICRFLATSEYVPSVRPYYNQDEEIFAVAVKALRGFKSNHEDPLRMDDTLIESSLIQIEQQKRTLILAIKKTLEHYEKLTPSASGVVDSTVNLFNSFFAVNSTSYKTKSALSAFLQDANKFSIESLNSLSSKVSGRANYLISEEHELVVEEFRNLQQIKEVIAQLNKLYRSADSQNITVEILDRIDNKLKKEGISLKNLGEFIQVEIESKKFNLRTKDLQNYRILKGQGISLSTRFIYKEADNNNSNMSKKGSFFDFDWSKANILFHFKERNLFDRLIRHPSAESFACNPENMQYFPNVGDKYLFYWPTKQPEIQQIIFEQISNILHRLANCEFEGKNDLAEPMMRLFVDLNNYLEKVPQTNASYWESMTKFMYQMSINLRSFASGRPAQELVAEDNIKHLFTNLEQHFQYFIKNLKKPFELIINTEDTLEIKRTFYQINLQLQELRDIYIGLIAAVKLSYRLPEFYNNQDVFEEKKFREVVDSLQNFCNFLLGTCQSLLLDFEANIENFHRNSFTKEDNEVYQSLATHPVFIFHKYKTFLKYILTNKELYNAFAKLNVSNMPYIDDEGQEHYLHDILIQDELMRIKEIRECLSEMDDFKLFLEEHGEYAFQLIKEEFAAEQKKYSAKTKDDFDYGQIIAALDFDRVEQEFLELCEECGVSDSLTSDLSRSL